ncbi:MAG: DUF1194 domain-containing protein [Alphaproteobacteria bacterium]
MALGAQPLGAQPAEAETAVDLELVLAVDVSRSMDFDEQVLQRGGYVSAFRHPAVIAAIRRGARGRIAVSYVEWAGFELQTIVAPWTLIDGKATAAKFARSLAQAPIQDMRQTSISGGLIFASRQFNANGFKGTRRVIDISGDGPNNTGIPVTAARDLVVANGIIINGLPVMLHRQRTGYYDIENLDAFYEDCVIGGFGSFILKVTAKEKFATAIRRKLILEIAGRQPLRPARAVAAQFSPRAPRVDCLIGEKLWSQRWRDYDEP